MVIHKTAPQSLHKRLSAELRELYGAEAPEVWHLWVEPNVPVRGVTLKAHLYKGGVERIIGGSAPRYDWEEAYQRLLAACVDAWGPAGPTSADSNRASGESG